MAGFPWWVLLEQQAYAALMKSPVFHRGVEQVVKTVHRVRYGVPMEELGGTRTEAENRFGEHFSNELRAQAGRKDAPQLPARDDIHDESHDAEAAWQKLLGKNVQVDAQHEIVNEQTQQSKSGSQQSKAGPDSKSFYDVLKERAEAKKG